jgi:hypothetical protein
MRGNGDGHRPGWPGAPHGTMTNGAVGQTVTSVDGPVLTVKFKDGAAEKKLIVGPNVPVSRLEASDRSELKAGAAVAAAAATKRSHGGIRSTLPIGYWESMIIEVCLPKPQAPSNGLPVRIHLQS